MVLRKCGLADKLAALSTFSTAAATAGGSTASARLCDVSGMDTESLSQSLRTFYNSLLSLGPFVMPQCDRILNPSIRRACRQAVTYVVSAAYSSLYQVSTLTFSLLVSFDFLMVGRT
jgi:predicted PurR-regulated permease PerM